MRKLLTLLYILSFFFCKFSSAQVLCIYCYDQNAPVSTGINNLVVNGGFENGCSVGGYFCPNSNAYSCDITNWTCTGGGINTYVNVVDSNYGQLVEGNLAPYFGNFFCKTCSVTYNDTSCINNIDCIVGGVPLGYPINDSAYGGTTGVSLEQTVSNLIPGDIYVLEFWAGGEADIPFFSNGLFAVNIGFGDTLFRNKPTWSTNSAHPDSIGTRFIVEFKATSSSHTIKFTNWGHICGTCTELVLDDVRLYTLAELDASVPHCTVGISPTPTLPDGEGVVPNPFSNELNIKTNSNRLSEIIFYDIASRKLLQQTFFNSTTINTQQLSKGIYFYEIKNKEGVVKKGKVVKE